MYNTKLNYNGEPCTWRHVSTVRGQALGNLPQKCGKAPSAEPTKRNIPILKKDREAFWEKLSPEIHELYNNKYESQLLRLFDFTAWMESKIRKEKLSEVLRARSSAKEC